LKYEFGNFGANNDHKMTFGKISFKTSHVSGQQCVGYQNRRTAPGHVASITRRGLVSTGGAKHDCGPSTIGLPIIIGGGGEGREVGIAPSKRLVRLSPFFVLTNRPWLFRLRN
jgi:hypothetical protein